MYRDIATKVAWSMLNLPYSWGGDDPMGGFDCSGLCIEILQSVNKLPLTGDWTAQGLYRRFQSTEKTFGEEGCLVFWGDDRDHIRHVEYCIDEDLSIGASGGGSRTKNLSDAIQQDAYVKVRPYRPRLPLTFVDPFMKGTL